MSIAITAAPMSSVAQVEKARTNSAEPTARTMQMT